MAVQLRCPGLPVGSASWRTGSPCAGSAFAVGGESCAKVAVLDGHEWCARSYISPQSEDLGLCGVHKWLCRSVAVNTVLAFLAKYPRPSCQEIECYVMTVPGKNSATAIYVVTVTHYQHFLQQLLRSPRFPIHRIHFGAAVPTVYSSVATAPLFIPLIGISEYSSSSKSAAAYHFYDKKLFRLPYITAFCSRSKRS